MFRSQSYLPSKHFCQSCKTGHKTTDVQFTHRQLCAAHRHKSFLIRTAYGLARNVAGDVKSLLGKCWDHVGSIPDSVIGKVSLNNFSGRTMALVLTQPLTEMCTGNISWR